MSACKKIPLSDSLKAHGFESWKIGSRYILNIRSKDRRQISPEIYWDEQFHLIPVNANRQDDLTTSPEATTKGDGDSVKLIHPENPEDAETQGVWLIGESAVLKGKAVTDRMELEVDTLNFVQKTFPAIPTPTVKHSWVDLRYCQSYFIMGRCREKTLHEAWSHLDDSARDKVANELVTICVELANQTSSRFETASGLGIFEPLLDFSEGKEAKPVGPFTREEFNEHFQELPEVLKLDQDERFVFCHPDLNPGNILVSDKGKIEAIIDWDGAGFYPRWYVATKMGSYSFQLDLRAKVQDEHSWQKLIIHKLVNSGFPSRKEFWNWMSRI